MNKGGMKIEYKGQSILAKGAQRNGRMKGYKKNVSEFDRIAV